MWEIINAILAFGAGFVIYNTSLSILGIFPPIKRTILPAFIFSITLYVSKLLLHSPTVVYTIVVVVFCGIYLYLFNQINFITCMIGALVTSNVIMLGDILILNPLILTKKISINGDFASFNWIMLNLIEVSFPVLIWLVNRAKSIFTINLFLYNGRRFYGSD